IIVTDALSHRPTLAGGPAGIDLRWLVGQTRTKQTSITDHIRQKGARRLPPTERRSWGSRSAEGGVAEETRSRRASGLAAVALRPGYLEPLITHVFTCQRASYRTFTLRHTGSSVHVPLTFTCRTRMSSALSLTRQT